MERKINERILNIKGTEIKLEGLNKEQNNLCDIIEEICMIDNRAARLITFIFNNLGREALLVNNNLKEFTESHMPDKADYNILTNWIKEFDSNINKSKFSAANMRRKDINIPNLNTVKIRPSLYVNRNNLILINKIAYDLVQEFEVIKTDYESVIIIAKTLDNVLKDNPIEKPKTISINSTNIRIDELSYIAFPGSAVYTMSYNTLRLIIKEFKTIYNEIAEQEMFEHLCESLTEDNLKEIDAQQPACDLGKGRYMMFTPLGNFTTHRKPSCINCNILRICEYKYKK